MATKRNGSNGVEISFAQFKEEIAAIGDILVSSKDQFAQAQFDLGLAWRKARSMGFYQVEGDKQNTPKARLEFMKDSKRGVDWIDPQFNSKLASYAWESTITHLPDYDLFEEVFTSMAYADRGRRERFQCAYALHKAIKDRVDASKKVNITAAFVKAALTPKKDSGKKGDGKSDGKGNGEAAATPETPDAAIESLFDSLDVIEQLVALPKEYLDAVKLLRTLELA